MWTHTLRLCRPLFAMQSRLRHWEPGGRVLIIAPHPDDECAGAGGTAALHLRAGDDLAVVILTDGGRSRGLGLSREQMVARRYKEARAAMRALGVSRWTSLALREGEWEEEEASEALRPLMEEVDIIYAPSCVDFHPEHLRVARVVAGLVRPEQVVRSYELNVPLGMLANLVAGFADVEETRRNALACYTSQQGALRPLHRLLAYRASLYGIMPCEPFWELPGNLYQRVVEAGRWGWRESPFRGLRPRPLSDPLAFACGWRTRGALDRLASVP